MFRTLRQQKGQGVVSQYATIFALVVAALTAMTVYVKRAVQGRIYATHKYMIEGIQSETLDNPGLNLVGNLSYEYEPYYVERETILERRETIVDRQFSDTIGKEYEDYHVDVKMTANQLSAEHADE
ncbi:MAG: hypothetical protein ACLFPX_07150 [Candidatus Omnitrophota bacterium]